MIALTATQKGGSEEGELKTADEKDVQMTLVIEDKNLAAKAEAIS